MNNNNNNNINIIPAKSYYDLEKCKGIILKENKGKCGIYRLTNLINNKSYIGSSVNLGRRLYDYYYIDKFKKINNKSDILIGNAILKYGIFNFQLDIIEYCDLNILTKKE
jgi:GIY-YIG catalytic domain